MNAPARAPLTFEIAPGTPQRECRSCKAPVFWILTALGKRMPVNADGTSHFSNCPNADAHRKPKPARTP